MRSIPYSSTQRFFFIQKEEGVFWHTESYRLLCQGTSQEDRRRRKKNRTAHSFFCVLVVVAWLNGQRLFNWLESEQIMFLCISHDVSQIIEVRIHLSSGLKNQWWSDPWDLAFLTASNYNYRFFGVFSSIQSSNVLDIHGFFVFFSRVASYSTVFEVLLSTTLCNSFCGQFWAFTEWRRKELPCSCIECEYNWFSFSSLTCWICALMLFVPSRLPVSFHKLCF